MCAINVTLDTANTNIVLQHTTDKDIIIVVATSCTGSICSTWFICNNKT